MVRLKLAPSSKLEGLPLPAEVLQLDLRRKVDLEKVGRPARPSCLRFFFFFFYINTAKPTVYGVA